MQVPKSESSGRLQGVCIHVIILTSIELTPSNRHEFQWFERLKALEHSKTRCSEATGTSYSSQQVLLGWSVGY